MTEVVQGSPEWHALRLGKVTASRVADVVARTKGGYAASRANYMAELITERLTGLAPETYVSVAMQWGKDHEEEARTAYEFHRDTTIQLIAFVGHPTIRHAGCSPDGLIGEDGLAEFKCPNTATHIDTLVNGKPPSRYALQIQFQLACTKRAWCDFVSFDPRVPERMRLFVCRVARDPIIIGDLDKEVQKFLVESDAKYKQLIERYGVQEAA
jgi:putative phage-type endonuclease